MRIPFPLMDLGLGLGLVLASATPTACLAAGAPVAIVEDITGHVPGVELMDYLDPGATIRLGPGDTIVISYFSSCLRETIRGGTVTIGAERSEATAGKVERARVSCEAGKMLGATGQASDSADLIVRGGGAPAIKAAPAPAFTIFGSSPLFQLSGVGRIVVARLDAKGEYVVKTIEARPDSRDALWDFASEQHALTPGGVYGVRWGGVLTVFKIDPSAKPGKTPVIGRLVRPPSKG